LIAISEGFDMTNPYGPGNGQDVGRADFSIEPFDS
jgi:hypothetical protein